MNEAALNQCLWKNLQQGLFQGTRAVENGKQIALVRGSQAPKGEVAEQVDTGRIALLHLLYQLGRLPLPEPRNRTAALSDEIVGTQALATAGAHSA